MLDVATMAILGVIHKVIVGVQMLPANIWEYSHSCSHFTVMYINNCVYLIFEMAVSFSEFFWVFNLSSSINWVKKVTSDVLRVFSTIVSFQWLSRRPSYDIFILIWNINVLLYFVCETYGAEVWGQMGHGPLNFRLYIEIWFLQ